EPRPGVRLFDNTVERDVGGVDDLAHRTLLLLRDGGSPGDRSAVACGAVVRGLGYSYQTKRFGNRMPVDQLSSTFSALADPTRRAILARLAEGEATVNELAAPFPISAQ